MLFKVDKFAVQVDKLVLSLLSSSNVANVANVAKLLNVTCCSGWTSLGCRWTIRSVSTTGDVPLENAETEVRPLFYLGSISG